VRAFSYQRARSFEEATSLLSRDGAYPIGGGTDLLVCVQEGLTAPSAVVDLSGVEGGDAITNLPGGGLRIGSAARVHDVAEHRVVRERFAALAEACEAVGTPALRHMGTIGGNICQRPRCWYFRRGIPCLKNGGAACPAQNGENQHLAILEGGPCFIVHPSDPAVALTALDASVEIAGARGSRVVRITDFYTLPSERMDRETILNDGDVITAITLPEAWAGGRQLYMKLMQRGAWDFALASIAAARCPDGSVRMAMGGVAPRPWRVPESIEEDVASGGLDEDSIMALAERALYDAKPLSRNGYKVTLAASLLRDAMRELAKGEAA
jgi:xanthine dehydrogenase YagS FAD-binding subunit